MGASHYCSCSACRAIDEIFQSACHCLELPVVESDVQKDESDDEDEDLKDIPDKEIGSRSPVSSLAMIGTEPLRLYFNGPMIMALLLAVEAPPPKYAFIVRVLGGWPKKRNRLRKQRLTPNKAAHGQPQQPQGKLTNALLVFNNPKEWLE